MDDIKVSEFAVNFACDDVEIFHMNVTGGLSAHYAAVLVFRNEPEICEELGCQDICISGLRLFARCCTTKKSRILELRGVSLQLTHERRALPQSCDDMDVATAVLHRAMYKAKYSMEDGFFYDQASTVEHAGTRLLRGYRPFVTRSPKGMVVSIDSRCRELATVSLLSLLPPVQDPAPNYAARATSQFSGLRICVQLGGRVRSYILSRVSAPCDLQAQTVLAPTAPKQPAADAVLAAVPAAGQAALPASVGGVALSDYVRRLRFDYGVELPESLWVQPLVFVKRRHASRVEHVFPASLCFPTRLTGAVSAMARDVSRAFTGPPATIPTAEELLDLVTAAARRVVNNEAAAIWLNRWRLTMADEPETRVAQQLDMDRVASLLHTSAAIESYRRADDDCVAASARMSGGMLALPSLAPVGLRSADGSLGARLDKWLVALRHDLAPSYDKMAELMQRVIREREYPIDPPRARLLIQANSAEEFAATLQTRLAALPSPPQALVFVLPPGEENAYWRAVKSALPNVPTQGLRAEALCGVQALGVVSRVMEATVAKAGGVVYGLKPARRSTASSGYTLVIGMCERPGDGYTQLSLVASLDELLTEYCSASVNVRREPGRKDLTAHRWRLAVAAFVSHSVALFHRRTSSLPERVIVYRTHPAASAPHTLLAEREGLSRGMAAAELGQVLDARGQASPAAAGADGGEGEARLDLGAVNSVFLPAPKPMEEGSACDDDWGCWNSSAAGGDDLVFARSECSASQDDRFGVGAAGGQGDDGADSSVREDYTMYSGLELGDEAEEDETPLAPCLTELVVVHVRPQSMVFAGARTGSVVVGDWASAEAGDHFTFHLNHGAVYMTKYEVSHWTGATQRFPPVDLVELSSQLCLAYATAGMAVREPAAVKHARGLASFATKIGAESLPLSVRPLHI